MPGELQVKVEPWGPDPDRIEQAARSAVRQPAVRAELGEAEARLVGLQPVDAGDEPVPPRSVRARLYDYAQERALLVDVPLEEGGATRMISTARQPRPSADELAAAVELLGEDPELGPALRDGRLVPYRAMPRWPASSCPTAASSAC
jgi:hypothetical protein